MEFWGCVMALFSPGYFGYCDVPVMVTFYLGQILSHFDLLVLFVMMIMLSVFSEKGTLYVRWA